jgi:PAS domain S-box-containing protein
VLSQGGGDRTMVRANASEETSASDRVRGHKILIVEDDLSAAAALERTLTDSGCAVRAVHDGQEAIQVALEWKPDLVLTDLGLPTLDGYGVLDALRARMPGIPVVVMTTEGEVASAVRAMRAGADNYLEKPLDLDALLVAVERALSRKSTEDQRARLAAIVEASEDAIIGKTLDGVITSWNKGAQHTFGYSAEEVVGKSIALLVPQGREDEESTILAAVGRGQVERFETVRRHRDGRIIDVSVTSSPIHDAGGRVIGVSKVARDITDRKRVDRALAHAKAVADATEREIEVLKERAARLQAEAALRDSEVRFQRLAESGIIGIVTADVHGNILDANDTYLNMIGYSRAEVVRGAVRWFDLTPPELRYLAASALEDLQATGVATPWETESFRKDGSRVPLLVGVAMLEYPRSIAFAVDLSERKKTESENIRLAARAENEHAGRERAEAALRQTEEQFRHAQKMEAVGRLAGGVAHDFNNVLSVIMSYGAMILDAFKKEDPMYGDMEEILKAAQRAADLTRQLLMFSRQQVLEPKILDLNDVLGSMARMLRRLVGEDVELTLVPAASLGKVRADRGSIEQLVMNLAVNARDAMPEGGKLTIETANVVLDETHAREHLGAKPGPAVLLGVSDSGTGMDKATQARIFEPFFTTKEQGKGTGLGLSTVFGIVQQSGGTIWVYSEVGVGSTFKVYLPVADGAAREASATQPPATLRGSETILLVEDEEQVRAVARGILSRQGYRLVVAQNAGEALLLCEKHPGAIDLLLSDVVMPQMSGPELARRLGALRPGMKILCMSGYTDDAVIRHGALEAGIAFIQKPFTPDTLTRKVREVLDADG